MKMLDDFPWHWTGHCLSVLGFWFVRAAAGAHFSTHAHFEVIAEIAARGSRGVVGCCFFVFGRVTGSGSREVGAVVVKLVGCWY